MRREAPHNLRMLIRRPVDPLRLSVQRSSRRPAQALESPTPRHRQHETKRRATARFGATRRQPPYAVQQVLCYTLQQGGV